MNINSHTVLSFALLFLFSLNCSTGSGNDVAGGTGTGNPGGSVVVMLLADTAGEDPGLQKIPLTYALGAGPGHGLPQLQHLPMSPFPVTDDDTLTFTVESAFMRVDTIYFLVDNSTPCDSAVFRNNSLLCDSNGVILAGPFVFNLLSGTSEPPIDSLVLPPLSYTGMGLMLQSDSAVGSDPANWSLRLEGTLIYHDTLHRFTVTADAGALVIYRKKGLPVTVSTEAKTYFVVKFRTRQWLKSVNIKSCLESGNLSFTVAGELNIGAGSGKGPCVGMHVRIRENILNSGIMDIF